MGDAPSVSRGGRIGVFVVVCVCVCEGLFQCLCTLVCAYNNRPLFALTLFSCSVQHVLIAFYVTGMFLTHHNGLSHKHMHASCIGACAKEI